MYTENIQQIPKNTIIVPITWSPGWSKRTVPSAILITIIYIHTTIQCHRHSCIFIESGN